MSTEKDRIRKELERRGIPIDSIAPKKTPSTEKERIRAELIRRGIDIDKPRKPQEKPTVGDIPGQLAHGIASAYEGLGNLASKYIAAPILKRSSPVPSSLVGPEGQSAYEFEHPEQEGLRAQAAEKLEAAPLQGLLTNPIEKAFGPESARPTTTAGKVAHTTGEFIAPVPIPGAGGLISSAKAGVKPLAKYIAKETGAGLGAASALELTPHLTEEGTAGRSVEDIAKAMLGGSYGRRITGKTGDIAQDIQKLASQGRFKETVKNLPAKAAGRVMSKFSKPKEDVIRKASEAGVELPINVGLGSTPLNWIANNYTKSVFTSRAWKDILKKSDESMIGKVNESIDALGDARLKPNEASSEFLNFLKEDERIVNKQVNQLYDDARKHLTPNDKVIPKKTISALFGAKKILERDIESPETKKLAKVVATLMDKWDLNPKLSKLRGIREEDLSPSYVAQLMDKAAYKPVDITRLDDARKELNKIAKYDPEGFLGKWVRTLEEDINTSANKEYLKERKAANKFMYDAKVSRFKTELGRAIMKGEAPINAFDKMNSPKNIKILEKIAGESEKGKKIFNQLKQAKLKEILEKSTTAGGLESGSLGTAQFGKLFSKGDKNQELIQALLPNKKSYEDLADVAKIAEEFSESGRELLNTSGSALVHADFDRAKKFVREALNLMLSHGGSAAVGASVAGPIGAGVGLAGPWLASKLMSNPQIVKETRAYALARSKGQEKNAESILKRIVNRAEPEAKNLLVEISRLHNKREKEE